MSDEREEYARQENELDDRYKDIILDHYRNPRHKGKLASPTAAEEGYNPLCGDEVMLDVEVTDGVVSDIGQRGSGCSISQSSASMMSEAIVGEQIADVKELIESFTAMMRGSDDVDWDELGDLEAMAGVRKFPVRVKCATLAWHTLSQALKKAKSS
jgi:nitrogen fixation NifU-like protein